MSIDLDTIRVRLSRADVPSIIADAFALVGEVERLRAEVDLLQQEARIRKAINEGLAAEVSYLRACVPPTHPADYGHEAWTEAVRAAVAEDRAVTDARTVAWLRKSANDTMLDPATDRQVYARTYSALHRYADMIESGEHRREGDE